jgi:predicted transcriptional regulator
MTKNEGIDWTLAKVLFNQGLSSTEIAQRLNCSRSAVTSRMKRDQWTAERDQIATMVRSTAVERAVGSLADGAKRWVERMVADIDRTMDAVERCPPKPDLRHLGERENVLEKLNRRARLTFGLDQEAKTSVQIAFFQSPIKPDAQPIDAEVISPVPPPETQGET